MESNLFPTHLNIIFTKVEFMAELTDLIDKIKRYFNFTPLELKSLIISTRLQGNFGKMPNKKIMSPASGLGHKQAGGFAIVACLFVPHI